MPLPNNQKKKKKSLKNILKKTILNSSEYLRFILEVILGTLNNFEKESLVELSFVGCFKMKLSKLEFGAFRRKKSKPKIRPCLGEHYYFHWHLQRLTFAKRVFLQCRI